MSSDRCGHQTNQLRVAVTVAGPKLMAPEPANLLVPGPKLMAQEFRALTPSREATACAVQVWSHAHARAPTNPHATLERLIRCSHGRVSSARSPERLWPPKGVPSGQCPVKGETHVHRLGILHEEPPPSAIP